MIISNSSPLIVFGRINRLDILATIFGDLYIPHSVYRETVVETRIETQKVSIQESIDKKIIHVTEPAYEYPFSRKLHSGEKDVLRLALENKAVGILLDDKRARNEAKSLGFQSILFYTTDILKAAEKRELITSYTNTVKQLHTMNIFLPE